jgi:hypothetical protein
MASAQDSNADSLVGIHSQPVTILSNIDSSIVIIDGERVGVTPLTLEKLTLGPHRLTLQNPDINSWLASGVTDTFRVMPGVPLTLRYKIEPRYIITSSPFDAEVVIGDSVIGKTPLAVNSEFLSYQSKSPSIRKLGYEPATLDLSSSRRGILSVSLKQIWQNDNDHEGIFRPNNGASSHTLRLTLSAASTVLSGAAAAYFKIKADDRYQSYRDTGDPALLSQTHRLDTGAGIALLAAQISLGLFTYFVLSN